MYNMYIYIYLYHLHLVADISGVLLMVLLILTSSPAPSSGSTAKVVATYRSAQQGFTCYFNLVLLLVQVPIGTHT